MMKVKEHPIRDVCRIFIYLVFPLFIKFLPFGTDFKLYRIMGKLYCSIEKNKKRIIKKNLESVFGEKDKEFINKTLVTYYENHFVDRMQLFTFNRLNEFNIHHYIKIENIGQLEKSLAKGKGCILIHGHFGPAQLFIAAIALAGLPITQIGYIHKHGYSFIGKKIAIPMRLKLESKIPGKIFYANNFFRPIFKCIKNNEIVANAGDGTGGGVVKGQHIPIPFMNRLKGFPMGSVVLAEKTGAELLPLIMTLGKDKKYRIRFGNPIEITPQKNGREQAMGQYVKILENQISEEPGLWHFWDEFPKKEWN